MTWNSPSSSGWTIGRSGPTPSVGSVSSTVGDVDRHERLAGRVAQRQVHLVLPGARRDERVQSRCRRPDDSGSSTACGATVVTGRRRRRGGRGHRRAVDEHRRDPDDRQQPDQLDHRRRWPGAARLVDRRRRPPAPASSPARGAGCCSAPRTMTPATIATLTSSASPYPVENRSPNAGSTMIAMPVPAATTTATATDRHRAEPLHDHARATPASGSPRNATTRAAIPPSQTAPAARCTTSNADHQGDRAAASGCGPRGRTRPGRRAPTTSAPIGDDRPARAPRPARSARPAPAGRPR